jgi:hypothetical protein
MNWEKRLRDFVLAGGALSALACSSTGSSNGPTIPCGNANPDPCICGRPEADPAQAALCNQQKACEAMGGVFYPSTCIHCAADGGTIDPHCTLPSDAGTPDGAGD